MKKKLVLVTLEEEAKKRYLQGIKDFFQDYIDIEAYSAKEKIDGLSDCDVLLVSHSSALKNVRHHLTRKIEIIYLVRTFSRDNLDKLYKIPPGTKAMLVDYSYKTCLDIISLLYEIGIKEIDFTPVYLGMNKDDLVDLDLAVTPGLLSYVPEGTKNIIDIGWTVVDISTMMEIALKLNVYDEIIEERLLKYSNKTTSVSRGLLYTLRRSLEVKNQREIVLDIIDDGVMVINDGNKITLCNKNILKILRLNEKQLKNKKIDDSSLYESLKKRLIDEEHLENVLIHVSEINRSIIMTKRPIMMQDNLIGHIIIIKDVTKIQDLENNLRKQLNEKGHFAKYKFENISGTSPQLLQCIEKAKKIAQIDATVLITGESGTGKELFAQSIYNASARRHMPFIAINCAALPSTLLESELFGYEEGAFTNAKKGGKKGLLELAHKGVIFLDEIGDVSMSVQVKLLRFLQEKQVMRIGGSYVIPLDVRVIAATNQDLLGLVEKGEFREDLYYRINVVPLRLPSLRERKSDIPMLIKDIFIQSGVPNKIMTDELRNILVKHKWKGNVRELQNCIQYMAYMGEDLLTIQDLPPDFHNTVDNEYSAAEVHVEEDLLQEELKTAREIMKCLKQKSGGRRYLHKVIKQRGMKISEYEIRKNMDILYNQGYLDYGKGRSGACLTEKGKKAEF